MSALKFVQKQFPYVTQIVDATESIAITVKTQDVKAGRKKDGGNCALAKACKRQKLAKAAIIGISTSYLINGEVAVRYKTSQAVGREITSFDRHQDFTPGRDYMLAKISPQSRLGAAHRGGKSFKPSKRKRAYHVTDNVRALRQL